MSVWFTGDRNEIAKINGFTMSGSDLMEGFAFIWGSKGSKPAVYSVDISTGEVIPGRTGVAKDIKPFRFVPLSAPLTAKK